jgi:hypothetical protein
MSFSQNIISVNVSVSGVGASYLLYARLGFFQYSKDPKKETFGFTRPKSPIDPKQQEPKAHTFSKNEISTNYYSQKNKR